MFVTKDDTLTEKSVILVEQSQMYVTKLTIRVHMTSKIFTFKQQAL